MFNQLLFMKLKFHSNKNLPFEGNIVPGFHSVYEMLGKFPDQILEVWIEHGKASTRIHEIETLAVAADIPLHRQSKENFSRHMAGVNHQGIAAVIKQYNYSSLEDMMESCSTIVFFDHLSDEGNIGAIIRSCVFFGIKGIMLPKDRSAEISPAVIKISSGACFRASVCKVVNPARALDLLDEAGYWIIGASADAANAVYDFDWRLEKIVIVLGNEQKGISRNILERCHALVAIPGQGTLDSLNVSVAAGVFFSEIYRQRNLTGIIKQ